MVDISGAVRISVEKYIMMRFDEMVQGVGAMKYFSGEDGWVKYDSGVYLFSEEE